MTEVLTMSSTAGVNLSTYTYTSAPRAIAFSNRKLTPKNGGNPMYDRRVVRGSNFKREEGIPKWNPYFSNAGSLSVKPPDPPESRSRQEFRQKLEARARIRRESYGVYASHSGRFNYHRPNPRIHATAQTDSPYEPLARISSAENAVVAALVARTMKEAALEVSHEEEVEEARLSRLAPPALSSLSQHGGSESGKDIDSEDDPTEDAEEGSQNDQSDEKDSQSPDRPSTPDNEDSPGTPDDDGSKSPGTASPTPSHGDMDEETLKDDDKADDKQDNTENSDNNSKQNEKQSDSEYEEDEF